MKLPEESFEAYNIDAPSLELEVTKEALSKLYRDMFSVRYYSLSPGNHTAM